MANVTKKEISTVFFIMKIFMAMFIACKCCGIYPLSVENLPDGVRFEKKVFLRHRIKAKNVISEFQCLDLCLRTSQCESINIKTNRTNSKRDWCVINHKAANISVDLKPRENYTYFHVNSTYLNQVIANMRSQEIKCYQEVIKLVLTRI
ncbi:hypothetical protein AC249_AIPGENE13909 [Exaiptasia diaphana]|nr:hypothetical protein AC249_AIPGENE13909 [Exaiptasia diaphana]